MERDTKQRVEGALIALGLAGWILLGLAHTTIVMTGEKGWRPDRSAPGAAAVVGIPGDGDPRTIAAVRSLVGNAGDGASAVAVALPPATDSAQLLYTRYQLAHLLYPLRVRMLREAAPPLDRLRGGDSTLLVLAPGVGSPGGCRVVAEADAHRLVACEP